MQACGVDMAGTLFTSETLDRLYLGFTTLVTIILWHISGSLMQRLCYFTGRFVNSNYIIVTSLRVHNNLHSHVCGVLYRIHFYKVFSLYTHCIVLQSYKIVKTFRSQYTH